MKLRILGLVIFLFMLTPIVSGSVTDVTITPSNPEVGDTVRIVIQAGVNEQVSLDLDYSGDAPVSGGKYKVELDNIKVPGSPNSVSARASGVENLRIAVKLPILGWVTLNKDASGGSASLSQGNIPVGTYDVELKGDALPGESSVDLSFSAEVTLTTDSSGEYTYSYKTSGIPPGSIKVDVGGVKKSVTLSSGGSSGSSGGVTVPLTPVAGFSVSGDRIVGEVLSFDGGSSKPTYGTITKYEWSFGDGSTGSGETIDHVYDTAGEYSIKLTVTNSVGLSDDKMVKITVEEDPNLAPVAVPGSDRGCFVEQLVDFTSQSIDPDGVLVSYLWDFDDGVTGEGKKIQHSWSEPGLYYVNHTVVDDRGARASGFLTVKVETLSVEVEYFKNVTLEGRFFQHFGDLGASVTASGNGTRFYLFGYSENPHPEAVLPVSQVGGIVDFVVGNPDMVDWPIYFELSYPEGVVPEAAEASLGLYYFNGVAWVRCVQTGVDLGSGVVWANLTQGELVGSPLTVGIVAPLPYFEYGGLVVPERVEEDSVALVQYTLMNSGDKAGNVVTLVYLDGEPVVSKTVHIESGVEVDQSIGVIVGERGVHLVQVEDMLAELIVVPATVPDLVSFVDLDSSEVMVGDSVSFSYGLRNTGNRTAMDVTCSLVVNGLVVSSTRVDVVEAGAELSYDYVFTPGKGMVNSVSFNVDTLDMVSETEETNNVDVVEFESVKPVDYGLYTAILSLLVVSLYVLHYKGILKIPF